MSVDAFWPRIQAHAAWKGMALDPYLLAAIIQVESAGRMLAVRYEPKYKWFSALSQNAAENHTTIETETELQKFSYGLCQLMGGTLRDLGLKGPLPQAFDPETNLEYGAKMLARLTAQYPVLRDAISAYNAGSPRHLAGQYENQGYVDAVTAAMTSIKARLVLSP